MIPKPTKTNQMLPSINIAGFPSAPDANDGLGIAVEELVDNPLPVGIV